MNMKNEWKLMTVFFTKTGETEFVTWNDSDITDEVSDVLDEVPDFDDSEVSTLD